MDISGRIKNGNNPYGYQPEDIAGTPQEGLHQSFPSASVRYQLNDKHEFYASYSKRINRPSHFDLNPFRFYDDPFNYWQEIQT
jgi:hypothetical protein